MLGGKRVNKVNKVFVIAMFGHFSEEAICRYSYLIEEKLGISFSEGDTYDFTRCMRTDGSFYGTAGECRKGTLADPKEKEASAKAGGYQPKKDSGKDKGVKSIPTITEDMKNRGLLDPFDPKGYQAKIDEVNDPKEKLDEWGLPMPPLSPIVKAERLKEYEMRKSHSTINKEFLNELEKNLPSGTELKRGTEQLYITSVTEDGNKVMTYYSPKTGYNFNINGSSSSADAGITSRKAQLEAAQLARGHYDAVVKALPVGAVLHTQAYHKDGKGDARQRIYERMGFSKATPPDSIFAVKQKDGSMAPSTQGDWNGQRNNEKALWFSEQSERERDAMWIILLFGG